MQAILDSSTLNGATCRCLIGDLAASHQKVWKVAWQTIPSFLVKLFEQFFDPRMKNDQSQSHPNRKRKSRKTNIAYFTNGAHRLGQTLAAAGTVMHFKIG